MRFVVVGAGAMGSLFASHLARTEADVWVYDRWKEHVDAIRAGGLQVRKKASTETVRLHATTDATEPAVADVVMVFVKYRQTREALAAARPMIGPQTVLLTLQNGVGNVEAIRELYPANRVFYGLTTLTSELLGPGRIEASYAGQGETFIWTADGRRDEALERLLALFTDAGVNTILSPDIELRIWKKLIVNCCLNTLCAITRLPVGRLAEHAEAWPVLQGVADEIVEVAVRKGIPLEHAPAHAFLRSVAHEARHHYPSMLVDVQQRRATEIECLNGTVVREALRLGIDVPRNHALYSIIRMMEDNYA